MSRKIDALIAEKVMLYDSATMEIIFEPDMRGHGGFFPTKNISDAWFVVERMQSKGAEFNLWSSKAHSFKWSASFNVNQEEIESPFTDSAPLAICLAAMKAVGVNA